MHIPPLVISYVKLDGEVYDSNPHLLPIHTNDSSTGSAVPPHLKVLRILARNIIV